MTLTRLFLPLADGHDLGGIDGFPIHLHFFDLAVFADQESGASGGLELHSLDVHVLQKAVFLGGGSRLVAEEREFYVVFLGKGVVREGAIHADTQDLGIRGFQFLKVLLEVPHLLLSTTGEGENIKRQHDILLSLEVV